MRGGAGASVVPFGGTESTGGGPGATGGILQAGAGGSGAGDGGAAGSGASGEAGMAGNQAGVGAGGAQAGAGAESGQGGESGSGKEGGTGGLSTGGREHTGGVGDAGGLGGTGGVSGTGGVDEAGGDGGVGGVSGAGGATILPDSNVPSCAARLLACGTERESCCDSVRIPFNWSFAMGRSEDGDDAYADGDPDEQPEHAAEVSEFALDKFEVTVGRFRQFLDGTDDKVPAAGAGESENPQVPEGRLLGRDLSGFFRPQTESLPARFSPWPSHRCN